MAPAPIFGDEERRVPRAPLLGPFPSAEDVVIVVVGFEQSPVPAEGYNIPADAARCNIFFFFFFFEDGVRIFGFCFVEAKEEHNNEGQEK